MGSALQDQIKHLASAAEEEENDSIYYAHAMHLMGLYAVPMTLKAVIELGVLEIIGMAGGAEMSAAQIVSQIPTPGNPQAALALDRMLMLLASQSVLTCTVAESGDGRVERRYGLAPVCRFFTKNQDGNSLVALLPISLARVFQESWHELKYAVLEGVTPFKKAHGMAAFEHVSRDPEFSEAFNKAMSGSSTLVAKKMMEVYRGFEGLKELVDVGGGIGTTMQMIVSEYPHIKGITFDLPYVISNAPPRPGVEYVAGDMFVKVPSGEAIFMKFVLHDWSDELCLKILKNCHKALSDDGKVIIVDHLIPDAPTTDVATQSTLSVDLSMLTYSDGGKERSKREFEALAREAGFSGFSVAASFYTHYVMELHK